MRLFGTDGVRGVAGEELTASLAMKIGGAAGLVLGKNQSNKVAIVGIDTRISCGMLEAAVSTGLMSHGYMVIQTGVVPTPAVAKLVENENATLGVMISASHNPYEFNGIKLFSSDGYKLPDDVEDEIEEIIKEGDYLGDKVGRIVSGADLVERYIEIVKDVAFQERIGLEGMKVALDTANGSLYEIAPRVMQELGAEVSVIGNSPDGLNINRKVGSTHMDSCRNFTLHNGADIGIAFDGDADRLLVCDENGEFYDGDAIMLALALDLMEKGHLKDKTIVATVMSNLGMDVACEKYGINLVRTKVGDRYISEEMVKHDYSIGGEQSGHIIMRKFGTTGDGLLSAVYLLTLLKKSGKTASDFFKLYHKLPQTLVNVDVPNDMKQIMLADEIISSHIATVEKKYEGTGRVLIRPSGTEPIIRIMIEGEDQTEIEKDALLLAGFIEGRLSSL